MPGCNFAKGVPRNDPVINSRLGRPTIVNRAVRIDAQTLIDVNPGPGNIIPALQLGNSYVVATRDAAKCVSTANGVHYSWFAISIVGS